MTGVARAKRILAVYDAAVFMFKGSEAIYRSVVSAGLLPAADYWAPIVRRDAAAIVATIAECSPEGEK